VRLLAPQVGDILSDVRVIDEGWVHGTVERSGATGETRMVAIVFTRQGHLARMPMMYTDCHTMPVMTATIYQHVAACPRRSGAPKLSCATGFA